MTDTLSHDETLSEVVGGEGHGLLTLPNGRSIPFKAHPLADLFPMMSADEMAALVEDVRERGVQRPIVLLNGMVLDGRNRYHAARAAEVGYRVVDFTGEDPLAFVISENMRRRHLTDSQRAMVAAKIAKLPKGANQHTPNGGPSLSQAAAAESLNVPVRTVQRAKQVVDGGDPALVSAVEQGQVSVTAAAEIAKLPEAEQVEIVAQGPAALKEAAKAARQPKPQTAKASTRPADALTPEALAEENEALKADLEQTKAKLEKITRERDSLKARLADHTADDKDAVIRRMTKDAENLRSARFRAEEKAAVWSRQVHGLKKRVAELEQTPIEMDA